MNRALIGPGAMSEMAKNLIASNPALGALIPNDVKESIAKFDQASAASVGLKGDAPMRFGFNIGAMYDVNDKITLGVSYRSKVTAKVKEGKIALDYTNETELMQLMQKVNSLLTMMGKSEITVPPLDKGSFSAELPLPSNLNVGSNGRSPL